MVFVVRWLVEENWRRTYIAPGLARPPNADNWLIRWWTAISLSDSLIEHGLIDGLKTWIDCLSRKE
jgi:hypothetical protein